MEKLNINNLLQQKTSYAEGKVLDSFEEDGIRLFLVDGREKRPVRDVGPISESTKDICPYCQEAIPCAHLGDIGDWHIVENKFPGTDIELTGVSKKHSPHLKNTDFRAWMHMAITTDSTLIYSPARKSLPEHKHVQLLDHKTADVFKEKIQWIDNDVGYTNEHEYKAIVIKGDFETRLNRTVSILQNLYLKEHLYSLTITPEVTYILPSKVMDRVLDVRVFIGIISVTDKSAFDEIKQKLIQGDKSSIITDFSDCNYEENELTDLCRKSPDSLPDIPELKNKLDSLKADLGGVLVFGESDIPYGLSISNSLGIEFQNCSFAFTTDKKSNFFPDCMPPAFNHLDNKDLLIKVDKLTKNIRAYVTSLIDYYKVNNVYIISNSDSDQNTCNLEQISKDEVDRSTPKDQSILKLIKETETPADTFLMEQVNKIKSSFKNPPAFTEMIIGLNVKKVQDISFLQKEFPSATTKIFSSVDADDEWKTIDDYVRNNIQPVLRDFNPATSKLLEYVAKNYQDIIRSQPVSRCEEGVIVLYVGSSDSTVHTNMYTNFTSILIMNTGRKIQIVYDDKVDGSLADSISDIPIKEFDKLKPGSEVLILEDHIIKKMGQNELESYMLLRRYSDRLHNEKIKIIVPELLDYDFNTQQALITKIGFIPQYPPQEYFGLTKIYDNEYYKNYLNIVDIIKSNIPIKEINNKTDYDISINNAASPILKIIENDIKGGESAEVTELTNKVLKMVSETNDLIKDLPLYPSHKDLNPNNCSLKKDGGRAFVKLVDWEKFGLSRNGYDEGVLMSLLALDTKKQEEYWSLVKDRLNHLERLYFWRITATRTLHEIYSVYNRLYDSRIKLGLKNLNDISELEKNKKMLLSSLSDLTQKALLKINLEK